MKKWSLAAALIFCSMSAYANPTSDELFENIRFVHVTEYLKDHTIVPGTAIMLSNVNPALVKPKVFDPNNPHFQIQAFKKPGLYRFFDTQRFLASGRVTSHWTVNEAVEDIPEFYEKSGGKGHSDWSEATIGIVEPAKHFKNQLYGGFDQDFMVIGPHQLSKDAYILAPKSKESVVRKKNPKFPGTFYFYDDKKLKNAREAIRYFNLHVLLEAKKGPWEILKPAHQLAAGKKESQIVNDLVSLGALHNSEYQQSLASHEIAPQSRLGLENLLVGEVNIPDISMVYVNGVPKLAKDFFSSWIRNDDVTWTRHDNTLLVKLDSKVLDAFSQVNGAIAFGLIAGIGQTGKNLSFAGFGSDRVKPEDIEEIHSLIKELKIELSKIPNANSYLDQIKKEIEVLMMSPAQKAQKGSEKTSSSQEETPVRLKNEASASKILIYDVNRSRLPIPKDSHVDSSGSARKRGLFAHPSCDGNLVSQETISQTIESLKSVISR